MNNDVKCYLKKKYALADGGEMPDDAESEDSGDDSADTAADATPDVLPASVSPAAAGAVPDESALRQNIENAQNNRSRGDMIAAIGRSLEGVARANSMAHGGAGVNEAPYQAIREEGNRGVADAQNQRQQALQSYLQKRQMGREDTADAQKASQFNLTQKMEQQRYDLSAAENDPTSDSSKVAQSVYLRANPGTDPADVKSLSRADLVKLAPIVDTAQKAAATKEAASARREQAAQFAAQRVDAKQAANEDRHAKAKTDAALKIGQQLESQRGSPAVAQAERDLYASQKADTLANLYGDPNKLSPQQVSLLAAEVSKIAQGGMPTQHEMDTLTPGTVNGALASFSSKLTNEPTPANAAAFVKAYQDYTAGVKKDAQKVIQDRYGRVLESAKSHLADEDYNSLKSQYLDRFKDEKPTSHPVGSMITTKSGKTYRVVDENGTIEQVK